MHCLNKTHLTRDLGSLIYTLWRKSSKYSVVLLIRFGCSDFAAVVSVEYSYNIQTAAYYYPALSEIIRSIILFPDSLSLLNLWYANKRTFRNFWCKDGTISLRRRYHSSPSAVINPLPSKNSETIDRTPFSYLSALSCSIWRAPSALDTMTSRKGPVSSETSGPYFLLMVCIRLVKGSPSPSN